MSLYNKFKFLIENTYNQFLVKLQAAHFLDVLEKRSDNFLKNFRDQLEKRLDYHTVDGISMFKVLDSSSELVSEDDTDTSRVPEKVTLNIAFRNIFVLNAKKVNGDYPEVIGDYVKIDEPEIYKLPELPEGQAYYIHNDSFEDYSPCVEIIYRNDYGDDVPEIKPITTNQQYYNYPVNKYANNVLNLVKNAVYSLPFFSKEPSVTEVKEDEVGERQFSGTANMFLDKIRSLVTLVIIDYLKKNVKTVRKFVSKDIVNKFNSFEISNGTLISEVRNMFKRKYAEALQIKSDGVYASIFNSFLHLITAEDHKFSPQQREQIKQDIIDIGVKDKNSIKTILQTYVSGDITDADIAQFMKEQTFTKDTENLEPDANLSPEQKKQFREFYEMLEDSDFGDIASSMDYNFSEVREALAKIRDIKSEIENHYDKIMSKSSDSHKFTPEEIQEEVQKIINKSKEKKSSVSTKLKIVTSDEKKAYPRQLSDEEIVIEIYNNTVNNVPLNLSALNNLTDIRSLDLTAILTPFFNGILENLKNYNVNEIFKTKKQYESETGKPYIPSLDRSIEQDKDFPDFINELLGEKLTKKDISKNLDDFLTDTSTYRNPDNVVNTAVFNILINLRENLKLNNSEMSENIRSDFDDLLDLCKSSRFTITGVDYIIAYLLQLASIFQVYTDMYDNDSSQKSRNSNKSESIAGRIGAIYTDFFLPLSNYRNLIYNTDELSKRDLIRFHPVIELDKVDVIVNNYAELKKYPIENLEDGDIARVKQDENSERSTKSGDSYYPTTFYKWVIKDGNGSWNLLNSFGDNSDDVIDEDTEESNMSGDTLLESEDINDSKKQEKKDTEDDTDSIIEKYKNNPELQNILNLYNNMKSTTNKLQENDSEKPLDHIQDVRHDVKYTVKNKDVKDVKDNKIDNRTIDPTRKDKLLKKYKINRKKQGGNRE